MECVLHDFVVNAVLETLSRHTLWNDIQCGAGAGVQGTLHKSGKKRCIRFGSEAFASQSLPRSQQDAVQQACLKQGVDRVISVLVDSAADPDTSSSDSQKPSSSQQGWAADSSRQSSAPESQSTSSQQGNGSDTQVWVFAFEDTVHERSAAALQSLRQGSWLGRGRGRKEKELTVMMLTGDNEASAQRVAQQLDIQDVRAGLSPEQKLQVRAVLVSAQPKAVVPEALRVEDSAEACVQDMSALSSCMHSCNDCVCCFNL